MIAPASLKRQIADVIESDGVSPLRGMIAPASLKRARRETSGRMGGSATPGHDCPGLIEATPFLGRTRPSRRPLRGMIAPASLKLFLEGGFGGLTRPTPGHDCPGLIEAGRRASTTLRAPPAHSGA